MKYKKNNLVLLKFMIKILNKTKLNKMLYWKIKNNLKIFWNNNFKKFYHK